MAYIELDRATVEFPVYNAGNRSLKNSFLKLATGGKIDTNAEGITVIRGLENVSLKIHDGERVGITDVMTPGSGAATA